MKRPARLLIADFAATRLGVRMALADQDVEICAEAGNAPEAIAAAKAAQPDVCLVGSELPGGGIATVRGIHQAAPGAAIIVLGSMGDASELLTAVRAGAIGYVPGTITRDQIRRVFQAVMAGEAVVPRSMVSSLIRELHTSAALVAREVTGRQAQVLDLARRGHSPAEIAQRFEISPVTVRRHMSDLVRKLGLENPRALASFQPGIAANGGTRRGPSPSGTRPLGQAAAPVNGGLDAVRHAEL